MKELFLHELVEDPEVLKALFGDDEILAPKKKSRYRVPIQDEFIFYYVPEDINYFIEGIYENMKIFVSARVKGLDDVNIIINNFILYMLDKNKKGVVRYTRYNPVRYGRIPFFKWFISNLRFFYLSYNQQLIRDQFTLSLSETDYEQTAGRPSNKAIHIDVISRNQYQEPPDSLIFIYELVEWLKNYSVQHKGFRCFEAYAFDLFRSKIVGEKNNDFAKRVQISPSAASQWGAKLKKLVWKYLEGNIQPLRLKQSTL